MTHRTYFATQKAAWHFTNLLPKKRFEVVDYGKDISKSDEPYYVEYIDRPSYAR